MTAELSDAVTVFILKKTLNLIIYCNFTVSIDSPFTDQ